MSIFRRRLMMGQGESEPVPYDARIEYLESTGTQWIDTGIIPDNDTGLSIKAYSSNTTDSYVVGLRNNAGNTRWCIGHSTGGYYYAINSTNSYRFATNPLEMFFNYLNSKMFRATGYGGHTLSSLSFVPTYNIRMFGSAGTVASYSKWAGRIYYLQITQGDSVVMNLIPVRVGTVGYMYDKVSKQLFGNDGTGDFILGGDI